MGHGHGAALANILIVSPVASGMYLLFLHDICFQIWSFFLLSPIRELLLLGTETQKEERENVNSYTISHVRVAKKKKLEKQTGKKFKRNKSDSNTI